MQQRKKTSIDPNPPRIVVYGDDPKGPQQMRLHNPRGIADKLGHDVLAAFYKCFMGVERVLALEHLMFINNKASTTGLDPLVDEHAFLRNATLLGMLLAGTMHEVGEALQQLCDTKIAANQALRDSWAPLNKLRKEWNKSPYGSKIRNSFAFHLGEIGDYKAGIKLLKEDPALLYETNGGKRFAGRYHVMWNTLFKAHSVMNEEIAPFINKTQAAHRDLPDLVFAFFREVVDTRGVPVEFVKRGGIPAGEKKRRREARKRERLASRTHA
jgi:hypothetical protein